MNQEKRFVDLKAVKVDSFGRIYLEQATRALLGAEPTTILEMRWDRVANQLIVSNPDFGISVDE